jgi:uncharacterized metal-binding protein
MPDDAYTSACATCHTAASFRGECARMPEGCPTLARPTLTKDMASYREPERAQIMRVADAAPFTPQREKRSRVEELIFFAQQRGLTRVGVAFCVSMTKEAQALARVLETAGLHAELACCRVGAVDVSELGLEKAHPERFASTCNPVAQARLLDEQRVELIVQLGLCLGHDLILQEEAKAPVTTLVVKDRVFDHDPITALRAAP